MVFVFWVFAPKKFLFAVLNLNLKADILNSPECHDDLLLYPHENSYHWMEIMEKDAVCLEVSRFRDVL